MDDDKLLEIKDLHLHFHTYGGTVKALRGVNLAIKHGETLGLVGESGCGKSQTAMSLLQLTPKPPAEYPQGEILYHRKVGRGSERKWIDILRLPEPDLRRIRGNDISMIFQEPMTSLNPVLPCGEQICEVIVQHQDVGVKLRAWDRFWLRRGFKTRRYGKALEGAAPRAIGMLRDIGIPDPEGLMERYPHELSGGMRQRVMIAIGLSCDPDLLVADEPTTALDVTIQAQIMDLMRSLKTRVGASILLITHHLGVVAEMADRIAVMYAGRIVEEGPAVDVFKAPKHPYTLGLLNSIPDLKGGSEEGGADGADAGAPAVQTAQERSRRRRDLPVIPGTVPNLLNPPAGCSYHPRCPFAFERCRVKVPELQKAEGQMVACHLYDPDITVPAALRNKDASVYLRPPGADGFNPNPTVKESDLGGRAEA